MKRYLIGWTLALLSVIGFASTFVVGAKLTKGLGVSPEVLSLLRFTIAGGVMLLVGLVTRRGRRRLFAPRGKDWLGMGWLGPIGTAIMAWCVFMGCARVSAANASMADALTPLMIFAVAAIRTRRLERRQLVGLFCGLLGALLVVQILYAGGLALSAFTLGDFFVMMAAATWGVYTVYGREPIRRLGSSVFTTWTMLFGAVLLGAALLLLSFTTGLQLSWPSTSEAWFYVLVLGLVSTLLPFWTWNAAQQYLPMSVLGISAYFTPVFAVGMAAVLLGEPATWLQWLGTLFIVASAMVESEKGENGES